MMHRLIASTLPRSIFVITLLFYGVIAIAQDNDKVKLSEISLIGKTKQNVTIYLGGSDINEKALLSRIESSLDEVYRLFDLKEKIPSSWTIVFHGEWKLGAGYFHRDLEIDDSPTMLIVPKLDQRFLTRVIAHELVHLIHEQERPNEKNWIKEGLAVWQAHKVTGERPLGVDQSIRYFETPLTSNFDHGKKVDISDPRYLAQYGIVFHFFSYLFRNCPAATLFETLLFSSSKKTGVEFIDDTLMALFKDSQTMGMKLPDFCENFENFFVQFQKTRAKHHLTTNRTRYTPEDYIQTDSKRVIKPKKDRIQLEKYSASVYEKPKEGCAEGDYPLSFSDCLQIRLGKGLGL